ncbi:ATP-DEPENDENT CLP PROTEASE PROTEOLYTIC SUBUNIT [Salix purpurea]|uniref:ATP-dependent Clp protease proteolytic subunit n=1 Tax=Salix purpurea TaxID=77065 RepID=A0A9Q0THU6_SALPP|nr:ATP-DEPENDENT CLP PROTEASE PROTEOLYTIC SUBUNIT [Salix purpurea]
MGFSWMELIAAASGSWLLKWRAWRISKSDKSGPMTDRTLFTLSSLSSNEDYRINKEIIESTTAASRTTSPNRTLTTSSPPSSPRASLSTCFLSPFVGRSITGDFSGTKSDPNVSNQLQFRVPKAKEALLLWNVKPPIFTLCVGNAWGEAALLLAAGSRVNRSAIPSSTIMIKQSLEFRIKNFCTLSINIKPIGRFQGQATDVELASKEIKNVKAELYVGKWLQFSMRSHSFILISPDKVNLLAKHIGKLPEEIEADTSCPKYFSPNEAVEYGIIDKVLYNERSTEDCGVVSDLKRHNLFDLLWNSQLVIIRSN